MRRVTYTGEGGHRVSVDLDRVQVMVAVSKGVVTLWLDSGKTLDVWTDFNDVLEQMASNKRTI
jgi:hypothetical protein